MVYSFARASVNRLVESPDIMHLYSSVLFPCFRSSRCWLLSWVFIFMFSDTLAAKELKYKDESAADSSFVAVPVPDSIWARMQGRSYQENPYIQRKDLSYLVLLHVDLQGNVHRGQMICHRAIATDLIEIFRSLYKARYPIERMQLPDDFEADDERQMKANNTSCFCYRVVRGATKLSAHARGLAVDLNPLYNPCVRRRKDGTMFIQPSNARPYVNRTSSFPCKITTSDLAYQLFVRHGFQWGGAWRSLKDYQHFEKVLPKHYK